MKETAAALLVYTNITAFIQMDFIESLRIGGWFCLDGHWQSTVLLQDWLKSLERVLELIEEFVHPDFRP